MGTILERGTTHFRCLKPSKIEGLFFWTCLMRKDKEKKKEKQTLLLLYRHSMFVHRFLLMDDGQVAMGVAEVVECLFS
jgi:hypothetical protein